MVILDLETTGTWIDKDKIIEVAIVKCLPDGTKLTYETKVHPGIPIPPRATEVTGITNEDVKDAPRFEKIASTIADFIGPQSDLGGFNLERFDLPLLTREFCEAGMAFEWRHRAIYDAQKIYHVHEKRDLTAAYKFYCDKELTDAHSALADTEAALAVLQAQIKKYGGGEDSIEALKEFDYKSSNDFFDDEKKFRWWNGELYMTFGKYAKGDCLRKLVQKDREYLEWILSKDFSDSVKSMIRDCLDGRHPSPKPPQ